MVLTEENFFIYAAKYYDNPNCSSVDEFQEDLDRIKYLKKLFFNYSKKGILRERLIINHLIILYNVFEARACTKMLFLKLEEYKESLFPFLMFLGYLPDVILDVKEKGATPTNILMDQNVIDKIRELQRNV